jgi:hypothetical protein
MASGPARFLLLPAPLAPNGAVTVCQRLYGGRREHGTGRIPRLTFQHCRQ